MISDEERRKAVKFLRGRECLKLDCHECHQMSKMAFGDQHALCAIDGQWGTLADLIDRPTCRMTDCGIDHGSCSWGMRCSACGAEFEHVKKSYGWNYCPKCGAEVVS